MNTPRGPRLELRQTQSLTMTPQLQQAIKLLQMTNLELDMHVETEMAQNPFLERDDDGTRESSDDNLSPRDYDTTNAPDSDDIARPKAKEEYLDTDFDNVWTNATENPRAAETHDTMPSYADIGSGGRSNFENSEYSLENRLSNEKTLYDHITGQIALEMETPQEKIIAASLLDGLEETGYFSGDIGEIAKRLDTDKKEVEAVLKKCQKFDPTGLFARDLKECLLLQLEEQDRLTEGMKELIKNIDLLEKHDFDGLAKKCNITAEKLKDMLEVIRTLNPKPGLIFSSFISQTLVPDVLVRRNTDARAPESWIVELNPDTLPRVLVNRRYLNLVSNQKMGKEDKRYITEKINSANWLVRAMDQRRITILKVAGEIVKQQENFFNYGIGYLKPLVLRDIAEIIEMHESTVSRVTTNKYMASPRGVYELKFFFSSGVGGGTGSMEYAAEAVKARIKALIDSEDAKKILSDDKLVTLLKDEGIDVARRTVAKYREAMGIGSSVERRRQKKMR